MQAGNLCGLVLCSVKVLPEVLFQLLRWREEAALLVVLTEALPVAVATLAFYLA